MQTLLIRWGLCKHHCYERKRSFRFDVHCFKPTCRLTQKPWAPWTLHKTYWDWTCPRLCGGLGQTQMWATEMTRDITIRRYWPDYWRGASAAQRSSLWSLEPLRSLTYTKPYVIAERKTSVLLYKNHKLPNIYKRDLLKWMGGKNKEFGWWQWV